MSYRFVENFFRCTAAPKLMNIARVLLLPLGIATATGVCVAEESTASLFVPEPVMSGPMIDVKPLTSIPTTQGHVWYVSALLGNDGNNGLSEATPFRTIGRATLPEKNMAFAGGDVVVIMSGTYHETIRIQYDAAGRSLGGSATAYTTIMGMPGQNRPAIVGNQKGQTGACNGCSAVEIWAPYVRVTGLDVSAPGASLIGTAIAAGLKPNAESGVDRPLVHHVIVDHNIAHDSGCGGITSSYADYVTISTNTVFGNAHLAPNQCSGISVGFMIDYDHANGYHTQVLNNISYGNIVEVPVDYTHGGHHDTCPSEHPNCHTDGSGIIFDTNHQFNYKARSLVFGNLTYANGARGIHIFNSSNVDVINNTAYHNMTDTNLKGFPMAGGELDAQLASNVNFANNIAVAIDEQRAALYMIDANNVAWPGNIYFTGQIHFTKSESHPDLFWTRDADPRFILPSDNPTIADFHVSSESPAKGAGIATAFPLTDRDGGQVAKMQRPDIGAFVR